MRNNRFAITVVTVAYEDLRAVRRTCDSLAEQTCRGSWEHILVDGGSKDGTAKWYDENRPSDHSTLISEPDNGIYDAMNKGLAAAAGTYIVFLNAGDLYADTASLQRAVTRAEFRQFDWGYARARVVNSAGAQVRPTVGKIPYSSLWHRLGRSTICHQAVLMRTDFLRSMGGFEEGCGAAGDYRMLLAAGRQSVPRCWKSIDILYEAGGISDVDVKQQLWWRHEARVAAYSYGAVKSFLDSVWTHLQAINIRGRKTVKPILVRAGLTNYAAGVSSSAEYNHTHIPRDR